MDDKDVGNKEQQNFLILAERLDPMAKDPWNLDEPGLTTPYRDGDLNWLLCRKCLL